MKTHTGEWEGAYLAGEGLAGRERLVRLEEGRLPALGTLMD